jgi:hypothetical protein
LNQLRRGTAEDQEPPIPWFAIDQNPHDGEEFRNPLHLVDDEETVCRRQRQLRVLQACDILGRLEIEVCRLANLFLPETPSALPTWPLR